MTPEQIHDALSLLSADLIIEADKQRGSSRKAPVPFRRWIATAACGALVLMVGSFTISGFLPSMKKSAEAPAAGIPMEAPAQMQKEAAMDMVPEVRPESAEITDEAALDGDHRHGFADAADNKNSALIGGAYCGNTVTRVYIGEETFDLTGNDSIAITDILANLNYDPNKVCRCAAAFTVDIEGLENIQVHLGEAFARCEKGQADLTEAQVQTIREIVQGLGEVME